MRKKLLLWLMVLALALGLAVPVRAAGDPVEEFAVEFAEAVNRGKSEVTIKMDGTDVEAMMLAVLDRYPVLFHYFESVQWTYWTDRAEVVLQLKNTADPMNQIPVVDSEETLRAVLALSLAQLKEQTTFVCTDGFFPDMEMISAILEELRHSDYLSFMGYYAYATSYVTYDNSDAVDFQISFTYWEGLTLQELARWRAETEAAARELLRTTVAMDMPDYEKVLRIHDWVIEHTRYNTANMDEVGNNMAYGALVRGSCVCQGYAEAFMLLANALGVETVYVTGDGYSEGSWESHAWNAVKVQGEWYMIDLTWDDPVTSDGSDVLRYDYFLVSGQQLSQDHRWETGNYPSCERGSLDADRVRDLVAQSAGGYQLYDPDCLVTKEETIDACSQVLAQNSWAMPGEAPEVTEPPTTEPENSGTIAPVNPVMPVEPQTPEEEPEEGGGWLILLGILLAVAALGAAVTVIIIRKREEERKRKRRRVTVEFSSDRKW